MSFIQTPAVKLKKDQNSRNSTDNVPLVPPLQPTLIISTLLFVRFRTPYVVSVELPARPQAQVDVGTHVFP